MEHRVLVTEMNAGEQRERRMDTLVGYILLCGVLLSMALLVTGLVWRYARAGRVSFDYYIGGMNLLRFASSTLRAAAHAELRPRLLVSLGIIALMLTPYLRVLTSMIYFLAVLRNWKYTLFTLFVLFVLTWSLLIV